MSKTQYYYNTENPDGEFAHTKEHWIAVGKEEGLSEIVLFEAVPDKYSDKAWCDYYGDVIESSGDCGKKQCQNYKPINGKSGKCVSKHYVYEAGNKVIFKIDCNTSNPCEGK